MRWYLFLALFCACIALDGCRSLNGGRESVAPRLEPAPAAAEEDTADDAGFAGDISGVVITTEQGGQLKVYVVSPEGKQLLFTGAYAVKWIESWKTLALADRTTVFVHGSKRGEREVKYYWWEWADEPIKCDVSGNGKVAAVWNDGRVMVYDLDSGGTPRVLTREWIRDKARVEWALYGTFVIGIAMQPSGRYLAVTVSSKRVEETSGAAYPATAVIDLATDDVRFLSDGAPIVWLDDDTLVLLDTPYGWSTVPDSEAIVITRLGKVLGRLRDVLAAGAGPDGTVLLLREDRSGRKGGVSGPVFVEVRSRDLKELRERFDSGIDDWRQVEGFRITYLPRAVK